MRLLLQTPDIIPEGEHRSDILSMMTTIVAMSDELEALTILGRASRSTSDQRNEVKVRYYERVRAFVNGKPWLNELYYSMFMPLLNDTWIAKYDAGLIELNQSIGENRG
jgi:site-specific recombinase